MKKLAVLLLGVLMTSLCFSQDSTLFSDKRHEVSIGYLNVFSLAYTNEFGVGYKFRIKNSALRVTNSFTYRKQKHFSSSQYSTNTSTTFRPKIGYEYRLNFKRSMVFYGIDLCGTYDQYENASNTSNYSMKSEEIGGGFSLFIGFKYFINNRISISTETSFDFLYVKEDMIQTSQNGSSTYVYFNNTESLTARLSPLGIFSLNIHF